MFQCHVSLNPNKTQKQSVLIDCLTVGYPTGEEYGLSIIWWPHLRHRLQVLTPSPALIRQPQQLLVDFFGRVIICCEHQCCISLWQRKGRAL